MLMVEELIKHFNGIVACDEVSFAVSPGEVVTIVGSNGSGKSTLLNILAGEIRADSGNVRWCGDDITRTPTFKRHRLGISRCYQWPQLFDEWTVEECLDFVTEANLRRDPEGNPRKVLGMIGIDRMGGALVGSLTNADRKLLDLALSFAGKPDLLLLDEPCAGVFVESYTQIVQSLGWAREKLGTSILVVEHNADFLELLRRVPNHRRATMAEGRFAFEHA